MGDFMNNKILPPIMKFVNTKAITALKNGMLFTLPFIMIGSVFLILASLPVASWAAWMTKTGLSAICMQIYNASFGVMSIFAVSGIAYTWVKDDGFDAMPAGLTALVSFLIIQRPTTAIMINGKVAVTAAQAAQVPMIDRTWLGGQGMIAAILIGLISGWIYSWFLKRDIRIKLPEQVPAAVAGSFTALIPATAITVGWLVVYGLFDVFGNTTLVEFIYKVVQTPLQGLTDTFGGMLIIALLIPLFWFFGVHGAVIIGGIMGPLLQANSLANAKITAAGHIASASNGGHIVTQSLLDQFGTVTGSGMTLGLVVFMVFFAKSQQMKSIGRLGIGTGVFNINEPVLFGTPIVMNPILAAPFILMPAISMGATYLAIKFGVIPYFRGPMVPWTTPPIISGLLVGDWRTAVWQGGMIVLSFFVYWPFARKQDAILYKQEQTKLQADTDGIDISEGTKADN
ncbi:PTS sugar transporter subunit IIC [Lactiplantibacillus nangangensis]|uniref:Permease IIC component n=1 Tax=Lactiplantibacillus nangangensis TaxID=2559917 RepID=A0ABW1SGB0_9LACO|nr:PTS sugar transporter subunit IIC [Lactiplantibacillus nangangensis]